MLVNKSPKHVVFAKTLPFNIITKTSNPGVQFYWETVIYDGVEGSLEAIILTLFNKLTFEHPYQGPQVGYDYRLWTDNNPITYSLPLLSSFEIRKFLTSQATPLPDEALDPATCTSQASNLHIGLFN